MQHPFVSVIIPNYCHARYLNQRIDSVLAQTYQEFEVIILDDCSPDDGASRKVIEQYRDNPHVSHIVYNDVNSGSTFRQWDKGINLAKGELIWIAESDDFCEPNLLGVLVCEFERDDKLALAYTLLKKVDADGKPIPYLCFTPLGVTRLEGHDYIKRYMTLSNHCANASAALFKKEAYLNTDRLFTTYKAGGDLLFWIEIAIQGNVVIVNKRLNFFRQHNQKVTPNSSKRGVNFREYKKTYEYICTRLNFGCARNRLMLDHEHYKILKNDFESEQVREELLELWGLPNHISIWKKAKHKLIEVLQNRFDIYL